MWIDGHLAYGIAIIVANMTIMQRFHNYTGWGEILIYGSILSYFTFLFLEGLISFFDEIYYIFDSMFTSPLIWINMIGVPIICTLF
jgi:hypothetical protein